MKPKCVSPLFLHNDILDNFCISTKACIPQAFLVCFFVLDKYIGR